MPGNKSQKKTKNIYARTLAEKANAKASANGGKKKTSKKKREKREKIAANKKKAEKTGKEVFDTTDNVTEWKKELLNKYDIVFSKIKKKDRHLEKAQNLIDKILQAKKYKERKASRKRKGNRTTDRTDF